jgi:hypothetical protein
MTRTEPDGLVVGATVADFARKALLRRGSLTRRYTSHRGRLTRPDRGHMYNISPEEFFMYLTISLIILIPISVRIYRMFGRSRLRARLKEKDVL